MTTARSSHWTDAHHGGKDYTRRIGKHLNYALPSGLIDACVPGIEATSGPPADWGGSYEFSHGSRRAALQVHVRGGNRGALIGYRLSARPGCWVNFKAVDPGHAPDVAIAAGGAYAEWPGLYDGGTLRLTVGASTAKADILLQPGHPLRFRFSLFYPGSHSHTINADGSISIKDGSGTEWLRLPAPFAYDAGGELEGKRIPVATVAAANLPVPQGPLPTFEYVLRAEDLAGAAYPVTLDPTATITGTSAIEDNTIYEPAAARTFNYGGNGNWNAGQYSGGTLRYIVRLTGTLPIGIVTGFRFCFYQFPNANSTTEGVLEAFVVKAANDWVEGTGAAVDQSGSSCWGQCKRSVQAWAGTAGCGTSGVDFDADGSPPTATLYAYTSGADVLRTFTLKPEWVSPWRTGAHVNNGMLIKGQDEATAGKILAARASETATGNDPYFEIDYTEITPTYYQNILQRRRRG